MEFKGIRLGPALKIVGYSAYLWAKSRILNIERVSNRQAPRVPPPAHAPNLSRDQMMTSQERKENIALDGFSNNTSSSTKEVELHSNKEDSNLSQSDTITTSKPVEEPRAQSEAPNIENEATSYEKEVVQFQDVPGRHCIEDDIPLQKKDSIDNDVQLNQGTSW